MCRKGPLCHGGNDQADLVKEAHSSNGQQWLNDISDEGGIQVVQGKIWMTKLRKQAYRGKMGGYSDRYDLDDKGGRGDSFSLAPFKKKCGYVELKKGLEDRVRPKQPQLHTFPPQIPIPK
ncbi:hypothetical protein Nepgr_026987 [Nepenthes gracilis]|uniref:Uncharacterized protein n=1 Tax=Nepenthes gracilis TaxID=150966 RepID=A0AAD3TA19_NEPGR|nr:hypothetical protein Nepgr_026987 [Nepenthes gracilis]